MITEPQVRALAGKWANVDSPMLEQLLGEDGTMIVGNNPTFYQPGDIAAVCFLCGGKTILCERDLSVIAENPGIKICCTACFIKLEPVEAAS